MSRRGRSQTRAIAAMAAVAALLGGVWFLTRDRDRGGGPSNGKRHVVIPPIEAGRAGAIAIEALGNRIELRRNGEEWFVDGDLKRRTDGEAVRRLLAALERAPKAQLVSKRADTHRSFGVDEATGRRLTVTSRDGDRLVDLFVGKRPDLVLGAAYVRPPDKAETYLVDLPLSSLLDRSDGWRNRLMFEANLDELTRVSIETTTNSIVLVRRSTERSVGRAPFSVGPESTWEMVRPKPGRVKGEVAARLSVKLLYFGADALEDNEAGLPLKRFGLDPPWAEVAFEHESGKETVLKIGFLLQGLRRKLHFATVSGDEQIYVVSHKAIDLFLLEPAEFLE